MDEMSCVDGKGWPASRAVPGDQLAALMGSRLCHDLISPIGAIGNGLELLNYSEQGQDIVHSPEVRLIADSVAAARSRINWFRVAFGQAAPDQRMAVSALKALLAEADGNGRIRIRCDAEGDLPRTEARLILLSHMCLESAMPWGGRVLVCRSDNGWRLVAEAERIRQDPALWAWLGRRGDQNMPFPAASDVHFALLSCHAADLNRPLHWELDETGGEIAF